MEWIRLFEVATKDLDADAPKIRRVLDDIGQLAHRGADSYRLDSEARFAMGWWFFSIYVQEGFVRDAAGHMRATADSDARDERALLLDHIQGRLRAQNSTAAIKLHEKKRSAFTRYWTWMMR